MKNAATIFGRSARKKISGPLVDWVLPDQLIGVEIEVELDGDATLPDNDGYKTYWTQKRDGSLRNGVEYVLTAPMKGDTLSHAITTIFEDSHFTRSTTGSTHIHLDMMEEETTGEHIKVLTLMLYCMESAVFAVADKGREYCGYTNKLCTAPDYLLASVLGSGESSDYVGLRRLANDSGGEVGRYYGLNLMALSKFCSVEWRYFPTATSAAELVSWIQLVMAFKKAAVEVGTATSLFDIFSDEDKYEQFLAAYFSPWIDAFRNEAPQHMVIVMAKKALAVAGAKMLRGDNRMDTFDVRAVVKNKNLAKFVKKPKAASLEPEGLPLMFVANNARIPTNQQEGQIMCYSNQWYLWHVGQWESWANLTDRSRESLLIGRASINRSLGNLTNWLAENGVTRVATQEALRSSLDRLLLYINELLPASGDGFYRRSRDIEYIGLETLQELAEEETTTEEAPPAPVATEETPTITITSSPPRTTIRTTYDDMVFRALQPELNYYPTEGAY